MKTIILADCHVGSNQPCMVQLNRFLSNLKCDRLIFAGDLFSLENSDIRSIKDQNAGTIKFIREFWTKDTKPVYILGDEDADYSKDPILGPLELPVYPSIGFWLPNNKRVDVIHGHQFDPIIKWHKRLSWLKFFGLKMKKNCLELNGAALNKTIDKVHADAIEAWTGKTNILIMGHTHTPAFKKGSGATPDFYNAGDWKTHASYIEIIDNDINVRHISQS